MFCSQFCTNLTLILWIMIVAGNCFVLFLPAGSYIMKMQCPWFIGMYHSGVYSPEKKVWKIHKHSFIKRQNPWPGDNNSSSTEIFCKDFVNISHGNALSLILEDSIELQFIYFITAVAFLFVKYLFLVYGDNWNIKGIRAFILCCVYHIK